MLHQYLKPDQTDPARPSLQVHIICGDGRLFTAFRQEMSLSNILREPYPAFPRTTDPAYNALKHANAFLFESIGDDTLQLHEVLSLIQAKDIRDDQKIATEEAIRLPWEEYKHWFHTRSGPCSLSYFLDNRDHILRSIIHAAPFYRNHIAQLLKQEWNPYLAGIKILSFFVDLFKKKILFRNIYICMSSSTYISKG